MKIKVREAGSDAENARHENSAPEMRHNLAGVENARHKNARNSECGSRDNA